MPSTPSTPPPKTTTPKQQMVRAATVLVSDLIGQAAAVYALVGATYVALVGALSPVISVAVLGLSATASWAQFVRFFELRTALYRSIDNQSLPLSALSAGLGKSLKRGAVSVGAALLVHQAAQHSPGDYEAAPAQHRPQVTQQRTARLEVSSMVPPARAFRPLASSVSVPLSCKPSNGLYVQKRVVGALSLGI